jgi:hypothetical protein
MASIYPGYDVYQQQTARRIPVVIFEPLLAQK